MIVIEIEPNGNCAPMDMRVFHDLDEPKPVHGVCLELTPGRPEWCDVTGWTQHDAPCPAEVQKIDDSGDGTAWLIHGGDAGLRFRRSSSTTPWRIDDAAQWGEPMLIIGDPESIR